MRWKDAHLEAEFHETPALLQEMAKMFDGLSAAYGVEPVVTRVYDPVGCVSTPDGPVCESGVHPAKRAIDFRDSYAGRRLYSDEQVDELCDMMNKIYHRMDGKKTLIHHQFAGGEPHFHLQVPANERVLKRG
jgi:hypothetical protein